MNATDFRHWLEACTGSHVGWARCAETCPLALFLGRPVGRCQFIPASWERRFLAAADREVGHIRRERALEILAEVAGR